MAHDGSFALAGLQQPGQHRDGGGLAGAVWTEQAEDFAFCSAKAHPSHSLEAAEKFL
jgi:hypothetical protein